MFKGIYKGLIQTPMPDNSIYLVKEDGTHEFVEKRSNIKHMTVTNNNIIIETDDYTLEFETGGSK